MQPEVREEGCSKGERRGRDPDRPQECAAQRADGPLHSVHAACKACSMHSMERKKVRRTAQAFGRRAAQQCGNAGSVHSAAQRAA